MMTAAEAKTKAIEVVFKRESEEIEEVVEQAVLRGERFIEINYLISSKTLHWLRDTLGYNVKVEAEKTTINW